MTKIDSEVVEYYSHEGEYYLRNSIATWNFMDKQGAWRIVSISKSIELESLRNAD